MRVVIFLVVFFRCVLLVMSCCIWVRVFFVEVL